MTNRIQRQRLQRAHESGFLDACCDDHQPLIKAHGLWCWRMKLPMVWFERRSRYSRFGGLRLDMLTSPNMLTGAGQSALQSLGADSVSAHEANWEKLPRASLAKVANSVFRAVLRKPNYRAKGALTAKIDAGRGKPLKLVPRKTGSG